MQYTKEIIQIIISWPTAVIISVLVLRNPIKILIERLIKSESGKAKIGPVEIELGKLAEEGQQAVANLNRINYLMAESRLLELEITEANFGPVFSQEQRERMKKHIEELKNSQNQKANNRIKGTARTRRFFKALSYAPGFLVNQKFPSRTLAAPYACR